MKSTRELRVSGYVPPSKAMVARALWASHVYERALLEHAVAWGSDFELAWGSCDRLELVLPLAIVRKVELGRVAHVAARWVQDALAALGGNHDWPAGDRLLLDRCCFEACAPDVDSATLDELRQRAIERAGSREPGANRYPLLMAASAVAGIGRRRAGWGVGAAADGELVAEMLLSAFGRDEAGTLDMFGPPRVDAAAWRSKAMELARDRLGAAGAS